MKGSNIISAIHSLKMAQEHFADFKREHPSSEGARLFNNYAKKIDWILLDFLTHPYLGDEVREGVKKEINSDVFAVPAITEKVSLLNPAQREMIESLIDAALAGEEFKIIDN
jgi:hypothetical protein